MLKVANAFYRGQSNLIVLCIAPEKLTAEVKCEPPAHLSNKAPVALNGQFPHVYGAINLEAFISQSPLIWDSKGKFLDF